MKNDWKYNRIQRWGRGSIEICEVLNKQWSAHMLTVSSYGNNLMMPTFLKIFQSEYEAHKNSKLTHIHLTSLFLCIISTHKNSNYNNLSDATSKALSCWHIQIPSYRICICVYNPHTKFHLHSTNISFITAKKQKFKYRFCITTMFLFYFLQKKNLATAAYFLRI